MSVGLTRVVHVTSSHRADDVRIFDHECRSLAEVGGYDVTIAAAGSLPSGSSVHRAALPPRPVSRAGRFTRGPYDAWRFARSHEFDVWHFHDPELLPLAIRLARSGRTVVWDAHEDYVSEVAPTGAKNWIPAPLRGVARASLARLLASADKSVAGVVAATETIASRYRNPRTVVVGNEARLEDFAGCSPTFPARQVLFTGSPGPGHLFAEVVEAVESLPDVRLMVAGREPAEGTWVSAKSRLGSRIDHVGWLDRKGLAAAISQSSIGLATYQSTTTYAAASISPIKFFEFGAAGLPVVAVPLPNMLSRLDDSRAGIAAADFTSSAIADAIRLALVDRSRWEQMSQAGRAWAAEHGCWQTSEKCLLDLYATLTERG